MFLQISSVPRSVQIEEVKILGARDREIEKIISFIQARKNCFVQKLNHI